MSEPNAGEVERLYALAKAGKWTEVMSTFATQPKLAASCSRYTRPSSGWTFLHQAAYFGYECGVRTLIRLGASVTASTKNGETPVNLSDRRGHRNLSRLLEAATMTAGNLWKPHDDPEVLPSSFAWHEAVERWAPHEMKVGYDEGAIAIAPGSRYYVDSFERVLVGWQGTYDPPCGIDAESLINPTEKKSAVATPLADIVDAMRVFRDYFARFSLVQPLLLPELRVANEIAALVEAGAVDSVTRRKVRAVMDGFVEDHLEGTGRSGFRSRVREWLEATEAEP